MLLARIGDSLEVEALPLQPLHHMQIVNDTVESLLESDKHDAHRDCYLSVRLTENSPLNDPINHIRARFPYILNLRVKMEVMSELSVAVGDRTGATDLQRISPTGFT